MMRSITWRLILAFLLVGITVVALASGITYRLTVREFRQLTYDQARDRFVNDVTFYYSTHGSWDGVLEYYQLRNGDRIFQVNPSGGPGGRAGGPRPGAVFFALTDPAGRVVIPAGQYRVGDAVTSRVLSQGTPITVDSQRVGTVLLIGSLPPFGPLEERYLNRTNLGLLFAALGASAVALVLGVILARALTQPIRALTVAIRAMAAGDLKQSVQVRSNDELGELAAAFNHMSAQLDRLLKARRQMTADIAHDLRNPLTVIGGYIESMSEGVLKPTPDRLAAMQAEVRHLERLVDDLRILSEADAGELILNRAPVSVLALLERMARSYRPLAEKQGIALDVEAAPGLPQINADPDRLARVLDNLISNSLRYTSRGGHIHLKAASPAPGSVSLQVSDDGQGIAEEALPYVFDRLYRADPARAVSDESGLGLAIARSIVEAHGGTISAQSAPGRGTTMTIVLPVSEPPSAG